MNEQEDVCAPQRPIHSISKASKHVAVRRETIRLPIVRGDLRLRRLPGRKRPVITHADLGAWQASLSVLTPPGKKVHFGRD